MAVKLSCPKCGKELRASEEVLGKKVVCPHCSDSFRVPSPSASSGPRISLSGTGSLLAGEGAAGAPPDASPPKEPAAPPVDPTPPTVPARSATRKPKSPAKTAPANAPPADAAQPNERIKGKQQRPEERPAKTVPRRNPVAAKRVRATAPKINRKVKPARFIAGSETETRVQLGADGKLPSLVLRDDAVKKEQEEKPAQASNPLLLVGVLCFSVTISLLLLFVDVTPQTSETRSKAEARAVIRKDYIGIVEPFEPYQEKLRDALEAHSLFLETRKSEYAEQEKALYRDVVDLLRDQSHSEFNGLTKPKPGQDLPNDRHLHELLSTLLNEE